jgi:uncharacterized protein (TIGR02246 family)
VDLVALEELKRLKYRYLRTLDTKDWDAFAATLADDATADYGERLSFSGRDAITAYMRTTLTPAIITVHHVHHPEITVDGDSATGTWALDDTVIVTEHRLVLRGAAHYEDRYRRDADGEWRIAHTGYRRLYEAMVSLDDLPSWSLTANRWATPATEPAATE